MENYHSTGTKLAAPVSGGRKGKTSAERVYSGNKARKQTPITEPTTILKEPPKDHRKERLYILIENTGDTETLTKIRKIADLNRGMQEVVLVLKDNGSKRPLRMPFRVEISEELLKELKNLVGEEKVVVS